MISFEVNEEQYFKELIPPPYLQASMNNSSRRRYNLIRFSFVNPPLHLTATTTSYHPTTRVNQWWGRIVERCRGIFRQLEINVACF